MPCLLRRVWSQALAWWSRSIRGPSSARIRNIKPLIEVGSIEYTVFVLAEGGIDVLHWLCPTPMLATPRRCCIITVWLLPLNVCDDLSMIRNLRGVPIAFLLRKRLPGSSFDRWIWGDRAVKAVLAFSTVLLLAKVLGGEEFGRWVFVWSVCAFFVPLVAAPPSSIVVRECALAGPDHRAAILVGVYRLRIPLIVSAVLLMGGAILTGVVNTRLTILGLLILGVQSLDMFDPLFLATGKGNAGLPPRWIVLGCGAASRLFVGFYGGGAAGVLIVHLAESLIMLVVGVIVLPEYGLMSRSKLAVMKFDGARALVATDFLAVAVSRLDQLVIGVVLGTHDLGTYGLASRFAEAWLVIPMALVSSWMGDAARLRNDAGPAVWDRWMIERYRSAIFVSVFAALAMLVSVILAAALLLGNDYNGILPLVIPLSVGGFFAVLASVRGIDLVTQGRTGYSLISLLVGTVSSVLLLWVLLPKFGLMGGAIAIAASQAATYLLPCLVFPRLRLHLGYLVGVMSPNQASKSDSYIRSNR